VSIPRYRAQLASVAEHPPTGSQWLHELKYDGYRVGCFVEGATVRVESRRNEDWTAQLPEIALAAKQLPVSATLLDGELAVVLPDGTTSLQALQRAFAGAPRQGLTLFVFDLLHLDGRDLTALPLEQRKQLCEALLRGQEAGSPLRYAEHFDIDGAKLLARACALGARGIVSKRRDQAYHPGDNDGWLESTCSKRQRPVAVSRATPGAREVSGVTITTPTRPVYPALGFTKLDLAQLYSDIADWMLPYIEGRPLTLVRCERGVSSVDALRRQCKFLPHDPAWYRWASDPIRRIQIQEQKKLGEYLYVDSPEGLIALVQGDIIEIHAWGARVDRLEQPDRIVFDLDPGDEVAWPTVVEAAVALRDALAAFGLQSWPKLTGGKGVHVVLPFVPEHGWNEVYALAHRLAQLFVQRHPESLTLGFSKQGRSRKILVDYKRNHRAAVAVAAYSTRARPSGAVGIPLTWRELSASRTPDRWTVQNLRQRLKRLRADPWRDFWTVRQRLGRPSP
jgi:DNA ligase D-like protein (predicted polymerase)